MKKRKNVWVYIISIIVTLGVGALAGFLTREGVEIYQQTATKPPLNPPSVVFPILWSILYVLMAVGYSLAVTSKNATDDSKFVATAFYVLNLCFNFLWPIWFFVFNLYWFSFIWIILLLLVVVVMSLIFGTTSKVAMYLQIPYILWLLFASYLNFMTAFLN